jgi:hypothetical protein
MDRKFAMKISPGYRSKPARERLPILRKLKDGRNLSDSLPGRKGDNIFLAGED